jgi:hypothetical protein
MMRKTNMNNDFMDIVYNTEEYIPFQFTLDYKKICNMFNEIPVIYNNYSVSIITPLNSSQAREYGNALLSRHQLSVLKWNNKVKTPPHCIHNFRIALLRSFLEWEQKYISMVNNHFKDRLSENRTLTNHNSVKIQIGKIVTDIVYANELINYSEGLENDVLCKDYLLLVSNKIHEVALELHKVSGGRAFLQQNIIEMLCLFVIFKKIYFTGNNS